MQQRNFFLTLLMATVMMVFSPQIMRAAVETVTVGEGTSSNYYVPYGNYYRNSTTQMLYTADEIGKKGIIQSIAFYVSDAYEFKCSELKIYMGETDLTQLSTSSAFTSTGMQLVYSGTDVTIGSASGWETMTLSTPFDYSGEKNLVVVVCRKSSSWTSNLSYGGSDGKSLYRWSDDYSSYADIDDETQYNETDMRAAAQFQIKIKTDHVMEHHEAVAPTATTSGNYEYWYCATHCQKYFKDEDGIEEYADGEWIIPAGACPHQLTEHAAVPNTCGDDGNTLYYECNVCHHYFSDADAENEVEENSWVLAADPSLHVFTNNYDDNGFGKCDVCNKALYNIYEPAEYDDEENCFYIYNVGQLYWFADKVNNGTSSDEGYPFNARVYGDLVVNSNVLTDEGELNGDGSNFLAWTPIINYKGTFDGYDCTIKGLYCVSANSSVGLFSNNNGTISRISIEDSYFEGDNWVGGIVAYNDGIVENCSCSATVKGNDNVGGIAGFNTDDGVVQNCFSHATVKAATNDADRYGSVVGYNEGTLTNCYYLSDVADQQEAGHSTVIGKTTEQLASGDVAWLLNGEKVDETSAWGQFMGEGEEPGWSFPRPSGYMFVWKGYMCFDDSLQYANHYLHTEPNHDHVYDNGICKACGAYQTPESQTIDGVLTFDIANYGNALYVTKYTNEGNTCAARLVAPKVTMTGTNAYLTISNGSLTLDLNGDTLTTTGSQVILVNGGNVTIHDSSANGTGAVINGGSHGVNAESGSLTITGGTFIGGGGFAVQTSSSCTSLAISGGKYYITSGSTSRFYTPGKSALASGYSYYNLRTGEELYDYTNQPIDVAQSGDTVIVKQASVKAVLTKNGENINYRDFNSAFAAAQQCTPEDNATLKLMKNRTMQSSDGYITFSSGTFTLDLNGDTISNYNSQTILVIGANLTITDSSEGQTGMIKNSGAFAVDAPSGSLIITGGTFIGSGGFAVQTSPSCTSLAISGGKYYVTSGTTRLNTPGKSALAPGYSYYNLRTGKELEDYTYQPIYVEQSTDTVIVKQASVKAVLTKGGEDTNYYDFNSAFEAAQQCTADDNATLKLMNNRTIPDGPNAYITLSSGTFTLDLNGDTIRNNNSYTLFVNGANLTITDSSEGQKGALISTSSYAVNVVSGSLTVLAGNLIARNTAPALYVGSPSPTVSLKGGKYMSNNTDGYRVYTYNKSLLAPGYSYYNLRTDEEMTDITSGCLAMSNTADTLVVKQGSLKAVLTKNGEDTNYYDFNSAFAAAQQCTASDNATLKLMNNRTMLSSEGYITFSSGTFTLDLNGDTISNYNSQTILVSGANLTITDSSEGQNGALINSGSYAVNVTDGSLTVLGGNFIARNTYQALNVGSSSPTVSLKGGKYMSNSTDGYRVYAYDKSLLAPGYSYYNLSTDEEMNDVTSGYISMSNTADTLIVKPGTVKAVLTRNGEGTNYSDFNSAFAAAQQCTADDNATLKLMNNRTMPSSEGYITLSSGTFTLDLNGDTISNYNSQTILVSGANLTITDSSEGQNGALINTVSCAVNVTSGSLTVLAGNFIAHNGAPALNVGSSSPTVSLKGGKYMSNNSIYGYRVYTYDKSLLAPGYSYYNLSTDEEMNDVTSGYISMSNTADTLIVKPGTVKAVLTRNGEGTNYSDFNAAFTAAQQCTASDNATLKLMKNRTMKESEGYITFSSGTFTLDLNGDTISNCNNQTILVSGANLTITDSSEGQTGMIKNSEAHAVNATSGSLIITGGTFIGGDGFAVQTSSSCTSLAISGGKYYATSGTSRLYTPGKSALAPGYSYYNLRTGEEMFDYTYQPIYAELSTDTLVVKQGSLKAVLTKNGEDTNYYSFNSAFAAAQQCTASDNATLKLMKNYTIPDGPNAYITLSSGTFTLDLNGDTISNYNSQTILVSGANLTITDSNEGQNGALINSGSCAVNVTSGSLTVLAGNLIARNPAPALNVGSSSPTVSLKGGRYMSNNTYGYRVYAYDKSLLAPGYSYYNLRTDEEMTDITSGYLAMSNIADTLIVKQGSVKAILTKGDEVTTYKDINAAFAAAQQCTASDNAVLKLLKNVTLPTGEGYITLTDGAFTLDLNGDTLGIKGYWVLKLNGTDLTVTDSSEDKKGALVNTASIVVYAVNGSLTMESGNLKGKGQYSIYNNEGGMEITLLGGSYNGGIQYHANSTLNLPNVAMFNAEGNEVELNYVEYVDFDCYETEVPFTVNPYYTVGNVKGKLTKVDNKYFADKLTLVDGMPFSSEYDFIAAEAEYSRTMTTKWGTICLPFDVTVSSVTDKTEEGYQPFDFYYVDDINDDVMTLSKETQKVSAGTGMILRHDGTGGEVSIKETNVEVSSDPVCALNATDLWGTFTGKTINSGYYIANDKFWNAANLDQGAVVPPYRAYVAGSGWAAAKGISIFDPEEETTGVTTVTADKVDADAWYTLDGVKLGAKPNKAGIYIHGGKKVAVK